jgi:hypothetical protein
MDDLPPLLFEAEDGIAVLTLNRPAEGNALTPGLLAALEEAWRMAAACISCPIAGKASCAGRAPPLRFGAHGRSALRRDGQAEPVERVFESDLAREAGLVRSAPRAIQQVALVRTDRGQHSGKDRVDVDMAGGAGAAAAAQGHDLVDAIVAEGLHDGTARLRLYRVLASRAHHHEKLRHSM